MLQLYDEDLGYGSFLPRLEQTGSSLGTPEHHKLCIHNEVSDAIDRLSVLQEVNSTITDTEKIASFNVVVEEGSQPLTYHYFLSVESEAGEEPLLKGYEIALKHRQDPSLNLEALASLALSPTTTVS